MLDAKNGIRQSIITLSSSQRTHTHQILTPSQGFHQPARFRPSDNHPVSGATLPAYQTRSPPRKSVDLHSKEVRQPQPTQPKHNRSRTRRSEAVSSNPVSTPRTKPSPGPPGRRRGALTGNKLRRCKAWVKSPGHGGQFCTSSQVTGPRSHANRSAERGFPPNR